MSTSGEPIPQRIGDAERDRAVELLREHLAQGRLDQPEFDDRLGAALSARTSADLDPLFSDLPGPRPDSSVVPSPAFQAPPWQSQRAMAPADPGPAPLAGHGGHGAFALTAVSAAIWPITILLITFVLGWDNFWWLVFVPIVMSSIAGKEQKDRRERERIERDQRRLDRRRRALGDQ